MAKQTAVDWFEKNYHELLVEASINNMHVVLFDKKRGELFQQAKAMEKEQMYQVWETSEDWSDGKLLDSKKSFEEYYNEKYPNGKKD